MPKGQTKGMSLEEWVAAFPMYDAKPSSGKPGKSEVFSLTLHVYGDKDLVTIGDSTSDPNPWIGNQDGALVLFKLLYASAKDRALDLIHSGSQDQSQEPEPTTGASALDG